LVHLFVSPAHHDFDPRRGSLKLIPHRTISNEQQPGGSSHSGHGRQKVVEALLGYQSARIANRKSTGWIPFRRRVP
jgi:hypothetical protein